MKPELRNGPVFSMASPEEVIEALNSRTIRKLECRPECLRVEQENGELIVYHVNGTVAQFPMRRSFFYKLLRWYNFPVRQIGNMSSETVVSLLNDFILNMKSERVTLTIEDGEALTITGSSYAELPDLTVIEQCLPLHIYKISRDDFFIRIYSEVRHRFEPVPGDVCGFGMNVINSETGFRALTIEHYLHRFICSNGAVAQVPGKKRKYYHLQSESEDLASALCSAVAEQREERRLLAARWISGIRCPSEAMLAWLKRELIRRIGSKPAAHFLKGVSTEMSTLDLFNSLTTYAKEFNLQERYNIEAIAGDMLISEMS